MKIAKVETLHCDGGWRPWTFVRVETDDGLVGWGECSDSRSPLRRRRRGARHGALLIGQDPRAGASGCTGTCAGGRGRTWAA